MLTEHSQPGRVLFPIRVWQLARDGLLVERTLLRVPPRLAAFIDRFRRGQRDPFGGPANGQARRLELIQAMFRAVRFGAVVETGTYRGSTTEYLARLTAMPVITVEVQPRFFWYARWRLRPFQHVRVMNGDSVETLRRLARTPLREPVFFYLDAHWEEHLPLREEVSLIQDSWTDWVALVDDFQVPDDPGYGFDDYGPDARLTLDYLTVALREGVATLWPAAPSSTETATRKGCLILASASMAPILRTLPELRA